LASPVRELPPAVPTYALCRSASAGSGCKRFCRRSRDRLDDGGIGRIDRLHQPEAVGMCRVNLEGIARVIAVHAERRDQYGAVDSDGIGGL